MRFFAVLGFVILMIAGCGGGVGSLHPVEGKVTVDGKPLADGRLSFVADTDKGNESKVTAIGKIKDGTYTVTTKERSGAPAGWYKVSVLTQYPGGPAKPVELPQRYSDPGRSHLSVEVAPSPQAGAYDLKLSSR